MLQSTKLIGPTANMNQIYSLKFGLEASSAQPEIVQLFKTAGEEIIQASDGLCLKSSRNENEVRESLEKAGYKNGITLEKMSDQALQSATPNIKAFAGIK